MSYTASSSTASLLSSSNAPRSQKNFQQAFGKLSSSFGFGGSPVSAPVLPTSSQSHQPSQKSSKPVAPLTTAKGSSRTTPQYNGQAAYWASQSHKNFEAAYGNLAGTYGFGGNVPSPKARKV